MVGNKCSITIPAEYESENMNEQTKKEKEAKKILQSIKSALEDVQNGKIYPIDKLWDEL
jgi:hypothetical protein